jgi:hypothetical protein
MQLELSIIPDYLAICRLDAGTRLPEWALVGNFLSVSLTSDETSVVCEEERVPDGVQADTGWRAFKVVGTLDFNLTGVLVAIAAPLAEAGVGIFAISTYDTDYVLVKRDALEAAISALRAAGHIVVLPA